MNWLGHGRLLAAVCVGSLVAVGVALVAQHVFGVKPCPWCVLQRLIFLLIAAVAGLGWLLQRVTPVRLLANALLLLLAIAGVASAIYQHQVAAQMASCAMTFADKVLSAFNLETAAPPLFMVTAQCSEASAYRLLGLPYEVWSGLLFALILAAGALGLRPRRRG